tara:strand:- start:39 stop:1055 length:1017 start_codon:yes stop_codon:yes gene_type:complete
MKTSEMIGKKFKYSYTIGKQSPGGPGFRYPVDLAIDNGDILFVVNRGSEGEPCHRISKLTASEKYIGQFGSYGKGDGQFIWPTSVAIDKKGLVYIADEWLNRISIYDGGGDLQGKDIGESNFLRKWGISGHKQGQLAGPAGIAFDTNDNIYITENLNNRVSKFTKDGEFLNSWGMPGSGQGQFDGPWGISIDMHGNVYVADWKNDRIQKFTADGEFMTFIGNPGNSHGCLHLPSDVAVDAEGDIYVADWWNNKVEIFDPTGIHLDTLVGNSTKLSQWAIDYLEVNSEDKEARELVKNPEVEYLFEMPIAIETDCEGRIFVVDEIRFRIQIYQKAIKGD